MARPENPGAVPPDGRPPLRLRLRAWANRLRRGVWHALAYRMVFGERAADGTWLPNTRIAPSSCIEPWSRLQLGDHVFIGQFNFLDASGGLTLEEGVQITNFVSIITHSTHRSVRLAGRLGAQMAGERPGDVRAPVHIGAYSFIGPHSLIEAGSRLGRGTLVCSGAAVRGEFPDFAVLAGRPAQVVGDTRERDAPWLVRHPEMAEAYRAWAGSLPAGQGLKP